jgi:hypothetical protein
MNPTRKIWVLCVHLTPVALSVTAACALGVWVTGAPIHPPTVALMTVVGLIFTFWSACFDRSKSWHEAMGWEMRPTVETLRAAVEAEREACVQIALSYDVPDGCSPAELHGRNMASLGIASVIRARSIVADIKKEPTDDR